jgi:hypothetical protein
MQKQQDQPTTKIRTSHASTHTQTNATSLTMRKRSHKAGKQQNMRHKSRQPNKTRQAKKPSCTSANAFEILLLFFLHFSAHAARPFPFPQSI